MATGGRTIVLSLFPFLQFFSRREFQEWVCLVTDSTARTRFSSSELTLARPLVMAKGRRAGGTVKSLPAKLCKGPLNTLCLPLREGPPFFAKAKYDDGERGRGEGSRAGPLPPPPSCMALRPSRPPSPPPASGFVCQQPLMHQVIWCCLFSPSLPFPLAGSFPFLGLPPPHFSFLKPFSRPGRFAPFSSPSPPANLERLGRVSREGSVFHAPNHPPTLTRVVAATASMSYEIRSAADFLH